MWAVGEYVDAEDEMQALEVHATHTPFIFCELHFTGEVLVVDDIQIRFERRANRVPALSGIGAFVLVVMVGILGFVWLRWRC